MNFEYMYGMSLHNDFVRVWASIFVSFLVKNISFHLIEANIDLKSAGKFLILKYKRPKLSVDFICENSTKRLEMSLTGVQ